MKLSLEYVKYLLGWIVCVLNVSSVCQQCWYCCGDWFLVVFLLQTQIHPIWNYLQWMISIQVFKTICEVKAYLCIYVRPRNLVLSLHFRSALPQGSAFPFFSSKITHKFSKFPLTLWVWGWWSEERGGYATPLPWTWFVTSNDGWLNAASGVVASMLAVRWQFARWLG